MIEFPESLIAALREQAYKDFWGKPIKFFPVLRICGAKEPERGVVCTQLKGHEGWHGASTWISEIQCYHLWEDIKP